VTWIFGYGSLVWRPAFGYAAREAGYIEGWTRRFWQGSPDHRGVPEAPGRVVTLVPEDGARCWGVAYRIANDEVEAVLAKLDHREQGGYARHPTWVHSERGAREALVYVATPDNPNYLGEASLSEIAAQVRRSRGGSGANTEYVLELAEALRVLGAVDPHVFDLERELRDVTDSGDVRRGSR
jgi:cation transport regulator ChaC